MSSTPVTATANQLTELIEQARTMAARARRARHIEQLYACRALGQQLDAARYQLITTGPSAADAAAAFVAAGAAQLARLSDAERRELALDPDRPRSLGWTIDALDVLAWVERHGIPLTPWQRRAIERASQSHTQQRG